MLTQVYESDPLARYIAKATPENDRKLARRLRVFFRAILRRYLARPDGHVFIHADSEFKCVMQWHEVGQVGPGLKETMQMLPSLVRAFGFSQRGPAVSRAYEMQQPKPEGPESMYATLNFRGWEASKEGERAADVVIAQMLDRLDFQNTQAYTCASDDEIDFFERHGFFVLRDVEMPKGAPRMRALWRNPQGKGGKSNA